MRRTLRESTKSYFNNYEFMSQLGGGVNIPSAFFRKSKFIIELFLSSIPKENNKNTPVSLESNMQDLQPTHQLTHEIEKYSEASFSQFQRTK